MVVSKKSHIGELGSGRSELDGPLWSVISFDRCEASGLTYAEAEQNVAALEEQNVPGLCIVTVEAADRVAAS
jgi:hypothetical protein